jgi:hypothetical protein
MPCRLRGAGLVAKLTRSLTLKTRDKLVTLADARAVMIRYSSC